MSYSVYEVPRVRKDLRKLPAGDRRNVEKAIDALADNPRPHPQSKKLAVSDEGNARRLQVGINYRVIYTIDDGASEVTVLAVKRRENAYR